MKQYIFLLFFLMGFLSKAHAQDLIVTQKGDSLNCKIKKIKNDFIYFVFKADTEIRTTLISAKQVKYYQKDYYEIAEVAPDQIKKFAGNYSKFNLGIYGGLSYLTAKTPENISLSLQQYLQDLKSGVHFGAHFSYYLAENYGIGLMYNTFRSVNEVGIYAVDSLMNNQITGRLRDDITIQFFGVSIQPRYITANEKIYLSGGLALGYMGYSDNATFFKNYKLTGSTVGTSVNIRAEFLLIDKIFFSLGASYLGGVLSQYDYDDGIKKQTIKLETGSYESLSRVDLSVGLTLNF